MKKALLYSGIAAVGLFLITKASDLKQQINFQITDFKLRGFQSLAFWFGIKVAFDNHSGVSVPLSNLNIVINYVSADGSRTEIAPSKPISNKYILKAASRTELDEIRISVPLLNIAAGIKLLLQEASEGSRTFEVIARAKVAGVDVVQSQTFKR